MEKNYLIYSYEIYEYVYVGLTKNLERRDKEHRKTEEDSLYRFAKNNGYQIPTPKILETDLSLIDAKLKEENWLLLYISKGFKKINIAKCGLKNSAIGTPKKEQSSFIKKERKTKLMEIEEKVKNKTLTKEEALSTFYRYTTKSQMCKMFSQLYELCRENDWLKFFPKKSKPKHNKLPFSTEQEILHKNDLPLNVIFFKDSDVEYCVNTNNGDVYKINKKNIKKLKRIYDNGMLCYTYLKRGEVYLFPYHRILAKIKNIDYDYIVKYKDGNIENIKEENIIFIKTNYKEWHQTFDSKALVFKDGTLVNRRTKLIINGEKKDNGLFYQGINIDKIVFNYFIGEIDFDSVEIQHKDGNVFNNSVENLICVNFKAKKSRLTGKANVIIEKQDNEHKIFIIDNDEKVFVSKTSDETAANDIYEAALLKLKKNAYWRQWINTFKETEIPEYIKQSVKRRNDEIRCESSGCYWHSARKCWKSKIYYIDKEYSLGYFKSFEEGKMLYEQATSAIKFNVFENWYKTIENRRKDIKKLFLA